MPSKIDITQTNDPVDAHIGQRLKMRRVSLGITQQKLAKILNISFQQVQKYEKGINRMAPRRLLEISHALNINVEYFFEDLKHKGDGTPYIGLGENPTLFVAMPKNEGDELITYFKRIPDPKLRQQILILLKTLSQSYTQEARKTRSKFSL